MQPGLRTSYNHQFSERSCSFTIPGPGECLLFFALPPPPPHPRPNKGRAAFALSYNAATTFSVRRSTAPLLYSPEFVVLLRIAKAMMLLVDSLEQQPLESGPWKS